MTRPTLLSRCFPRPAVALSHISEILYGWIIRNTMSKLIRYMAICGLAGLISVCPPAAQADALSAPILEVSSAPDQLASYDLEELQDLGETQFSTSTIWTDGVIDFAGVPLSVLLETLEVQTGRIELIALNDYAVEILVDEALQSPALIAYHMDGEPMSPRAKGPLWLVYPFDSDVKYQTESYYSKSIWQIARIVVHDQPE